MAYDGVVTVSLDLIADFLNTRDERHFGQHRAKTPEQREALRTTADLRSWLGTRGFARKSAPISRADLELAVALRGQLRAQLGPGHAAPRLAAVTAQLPLTLSFQAGEPALAHAGGPARQFLASLAAGCIEASARGDWARLKLCAAADCQWAFHDTSRNRLARWCSMNVCGNRVKTRSYRARHSGTARR